jgi:hypothetical protein
VVGFVCLSARFRRVRQFLAEQGMVRVDGFGTRCCRIGFRRRPTRAAEHVGIVHYARLTAERLAEECDGN